jgi:hypothetical protein
VTLSELGGRIRALAPRPKCASVMIGLEPMSAHIGDTDRETVTGTYHGA